MPQSPATRESLLLINAGSLNQLGPVEGRWGHAGGFAGNYFLRNDWSTVDRFRGVQGAYIGGNPSWPINLPDSLSPSTPLLITPGSPALSVGRGRRLEVVNYLLEPNDVDWNLANVAGTENLLRKWIQDPGINEGDPYYSYFLESGMPQSNNANAIPGVFNRQGPGGSFVDHTFAYLKPSEDIDQRLSGGLEITIESVYNFYLDTMPAYEQVTSNVPEPVLPNFYIFETELRNTGSQTYSPDYRKALTMFSQGAGHRIADWFVDNDAGGYTETTSKSYYQAYASSLQATKNSESEYNALKVQYNTLLKNVAVLHSDIDAIYRTNRPANKDTNNAFGGPGTSALSFLPFYNIVTVGNDDFRAVEGGTSTFVPPPDKSDSFFSSLFDYPSFDAESFIDILQMYIITFLENAANTDPTQFHEFHRGQTDQDNFYRTLLTSSFLFDLSQPDAGAGTLPGVGQQYNGFSRYAYFLEDRITYNDSSLARTWEASTDPNMPSWAMNQVQGTWEQDNVVLIRDYSNAPGWDYNNNNPIYNPPNAFAVSDFYDKMSAGVLPSFPLRSFGDVLINAGARSETVLYKIDKRVVDSAGNILPNIVQTIYLSPKFTGTQPGPLQYIDSQVRYGVRYQYDIQQVRVVFGNQYNYDDLRVYTAGHAGYGRAVGNALGFYEPTTPGPGAVNYVLTNLDPYTGYGTDTTEKTAQHGYFVVAPPVISAEEWITMAEGSDYGSPKLDRVNLIFKRGFGFDGNTTGGAVAGDYSLLDTDGPGFIDTSVDDETQGYPGQ